MKTRREPPIPPQPAERTTPHEDEIRIRALEIYLARSGSGVWGDSTSDWLQAERELLTQQTEPDQARQPSPVGAL